MSNTTKKTIIGTILIDRSGSMENILPTLITSLHSFIDETKQTAEEAEECYFRIATFSTTRNVVYPLSPTHNNDFGELNEIDNKNIKFNTYGSTRLVDNISTFGHYDLKNKIKQLKEKKVHCIFMGANIDAIKTGEQFGFNSDQTIQVDMDVRDDETTAPLFQSFRAISQNMSLSLNNEDEDMSFSTLQRSTSAPSHFVDRTQTQRQSPTQNTTVLQAPQLTRQHRVVFDDDVTSYDLNNFNS